jgi:Mg-chelatase subunit ChlI
MEAFSERLKRARDIVKRVDIPKKVLTTMDKVLKQVGQDNDRVRTALAEAAQANAAFGDRVWVTVEDVAEIAELVLGHRAK